MNWVICSVVFGAGHLPNEKLVEHLGFVWAGMRGCKSESLTGSCYDREGWICSIVVKFKLRLSLWLGGCIISASHKYCRSSSRNLFDTGLETYLTCENHPNGDHLRSSVIFSWMQRYRTWTSAASTKSCVSWARPVWAIHPLVSEPSSWGSTLTRFPCGGQALQMCGHDPWQRDFGCGWAVESWAWDWAEPASTWLDPHGVSPK